MRINEVRSACRRSGPFTLKPTLSAFIIAALISRWSLKRAMKLDCQGTFGWNFCLLGDLICAVCYVALRPLRYKARSNQRRKEKDTMKLITCQIIEILKGTDGVSRCCITSRRLQRKKSRDICSRVGSFFLSPPPSLLTNWTRTIRFCAWCISSSTVLSLHVPRRYSAFRAPRSSVCNNCN